MKQQSSLARSMELFKSLLISVFFAVFLKRMQRRVSVICFQARLAITEQPLAMAMVLQEQKTLLK